jgi:hypothetical protein
MPARRLRISVPALLVVTLAAGGLLLASASQAQVQTLSGEADRLDRPRLGGVVRNAGPIKVGRAVITPGGAVRVLLAGDEPCGLWIGGPSTLTYRVEDRFSRPLAKRNIRKATAFKPVDAEDAVTVTVSFDEALLWGWELAARVAGSTEAAPEGSPAGAPEWLAPLLDRPFYDAPHLALLAERRLGGSGPGVAHGLFHGRSFDLRLVVDPRGDRQETLFDLERIPRADSVVYQGRYYGQELAAQPIGRSWWEHSPAALVAEHQSFKIDNDQKRHVTVTTTTRVRGTGDLAGLWWAALSGEVTEDNRSFPVTVRAVEVNGRPADFLFRNDTLAVALDPPLGRDQTAEVKVVHEGDYAIRYGGDSFWSLGTWAWFPTPPFHGWLATMDFEVRVPEPLVPFVSGTTTGKESRDGFTVVKSRLDQPMQWPVVAAGKYNVYSDRQLDVAATVATYVRANERGAKRLLNNFYAATECYQKLLNVPFPFSEVEVIEINQWGFGQAPPGVIFITQEAFNSVLEETDRLFSEGINGRYLHEIAHSYWPHVPKMNSEEENWTSESFADYTSAVCLDQLAGGKGTFRFQNSLDHWRGNVKDLGDGASLYLANHLAGVNFNDFLDRQNLLYSKGPVVLHALRLELQKQAGSAAQGDRQFWSLLRSYLKSFPYKWAGTRHLVGILNQITGSDWQPWFERYVYGTEIPVVR